MEITEEQKPKVSNRIAREPSAAVREFVVEAMTAEGAQPPTVDLDVATICLEDCISILWGRDVVDAERARHEGRLQ